MRQIDLAELKEIELNLLKEIHEICRKESIKYSICGGTLLGAVRHRGFIPWDDDIDIFMPRPDYNKFIKYCCMNKTPFKLVSTETEPGYGYLFAKVVDSNTEIVEIDANRGGAKMGVYVDVFPIDGLGASYKEAKQQFAKTAFKREMLVAYNWKRFFKSKTHSMIYEPLRLLMFVLSRGVKPSNLIQKIQKDFTPERFTESKYAGAVCGAYRLKEILPTEVYSIYDTISFEGYDFMCIKDKESYLTSIYGDYMKLPPVEKRAAHHSFLAYHK